MSALGRLTRAAVAALVGVAAPYAELAVKCRAPGSEACVWGRAYLPLTRAVYFVLFGGMTYAALAWAARRRAGRRGQG
ncbi:MAG TPA: hypothetical protein VKA84_27950 [Gemmatimonadaceae bacterium]|nr:hypothetical protein [Gemmatimonadaceae bacterium]